MFKVLKTLTGIFTIWQTPSVEDTRLVDRVREGEPFPPFEIDAEISRKSLQTAPRKREVISQLQNALKRGAALKVEDLRYTPAEGNYFFNVTKSTVLRYLTQRMMTEIPKNYQISYDQSQRIKRALKENDFTYLYLPKDFENTPLQGKKLSDLKDIRDYEISATLARKILNENPKDEAMLIVLKECLEAGASIQPSDLRGTTYEVGGVRVIDDFSRKDLVSQISDIIRSQRKEKSL